MSQSGSNNGSGGGPGGTSIKTLQGNSGGKVSPTITGNIFTIGSGSITVVGNPGLNTLTAQLTGLTNHSLLVGAGTATITNVGPSATSGQVLQSQGAAADPAYSTATYPATTTINQILYSSSANVVSGLATANNAMLITNNSGVPSLAVLGSGQVFIGSTAAAPTAVALTAGSGINIASSDASIVISSTDAGFAWNNVTGTSATMVKENGYQANNAGLVTLTLPSIVTSTFGDTIAVMGLGSGGWSIAQAAGQQIQFGSSATTLGATGALSSNNRYDAVEIVYSTTSGLWRVVSSIGNLTVT